MMIIDDWFCSIAFQKPLTSTQHPQALHLAIRSSHLSWLAGGSPCISAEFQQLRGWARVKAANMGLTEIRHPQIP